MFDIYFMKTDTPRTDAHHDAIRKRGGFLFPGDLDFMRELERESARRREALIRVRTWGIKSPAFDAHDNRIMAEWIDAGCNGPLPEPEGPWIYREMSNATMSCSHPPEDKR
jgi:hypothetical protein